jgi:hypothetical protein
MYVLQTIGEATLKVWAKGREFLEILGERGGGHQFLDRRERKNCTKLFKRVYFEPVLPY